MANSELGELAVEVANILRGMVARYGLSQMELAEAVGISQSQLSKMLRGVRPMDIDTLDGLAVAMDSSSAEILAEAELTVTQNGRRERLYSTRKTFVLDGLRIENPIDWDSSEFDLSQVEPRLRLMSHVVPLVHSVSVPADELIEDADDDEIEDQAAALNGDDSEKGDDHPGE